MGYEAEWLRYHSSYSIFITVFPSHTDICDLWATGRQPRSVCVCTVCMHGGSCDVMDAGVVWLREGV